MHRVRDDMRGVYEGEVAVDSVSGSFGGSMDVDGLFVGAARGSVGGVCGDVKFRKLVSLI